MRWLDSMRAQNAYEYALKYSSSKRYGLNEDTVSAIEQCLVEGKAIAIQWLRSRLNSSGTVQVVYSESEVCVLEAESFLQNWPNIFTPGRDDAIILHNLTSEVVFYCHEDELEYGHRRV